MKAALFVAKMNCGLGGGEEPGETGRNWEAWSGETGRHREEPGETWRNWEAWSGERGAVTG